jgi:hypothetical protein
MIRRGVYMNWDNSKEIKRALENSEMGGLSFGKEHREKVFKRLQADKKSTGLLNFLPSILSKAVLLSVAVFLIGLAGFFVSQELEPESGKNAVTPVVEKEQEELEIIVPVEEEKSQVVDTTVEPTEPSVENSEGIITIKDNKFLLKNIALKMSSTEVQDILGKPDEEGPISEEFWESRYEFRGLVVEYFMDEVRSIVYKGPFELDKTISEVDAARYRSQYGDIFLYLEQRRQLIKITPINSEEYYVYLFYEDIYFQDVIKSGEATPF